MVGSGLERQSGIGRHFWLDAAQESRAFFNLTVHPITGLNQEYSEFGSVAKGNVYGDTGTAHDDFHYVSWRTAVNWAVDYAWWKADPNEVVLTNRMHAFFNSRGMTTYGYLYELNGNMTHSGRSVGLIAFNGAAALAATDSHAMLFVEQFWNQVPVSGTYRYYGGLLQFMAVLHASGNFLMY